MKKLIALLVLWLLVPSLLCAQGLPQKDGNTGTLADVEPCGSLNCAQVNTPTDGTRAGLLRQSYLRDSATARENRITEEGQTYSAPERLLFFSDFNGSSLLNNQFNTNATTMVAGLSSGFVRINSTSAVTANIGYALQSWMTFQIQDGQALRLKGHIRHINGSVANKQAEFGFGFYDVGGNQSASMNEFIGFRWTQGGALIGVLEYSTGGAPTVLTVNLNGGVPLSDGVSRSYEVLVTDNRAEFWIAGAYQAEIVFQPDAPGILKASGYPVHMRLFNGASSPPIAPVFELGGVTVLKVGAEADIGIETGQALMGRHSMHAQTGLVGTTGNTALIQASATAPTATTGSNTATTITGLGGFYRENGAAITATAHSNIIVSSYQNPPVPEAAGAATNGRTLVITDIMVSPVVVSTALVGGGAVWEWMVCVGSTAVSLATADAAGGATIGTKSPRCVPLPIIDSVGAAATLGTVVTRSGVSSVHLRTPLVVFPGDFIHTAIRTLQVTAAVTAGTLDGGIGFSGFWQ